MSREEAVKLYSDKFGGFPYFLTMGMAEDDFVKLVIKSLENGEEIKPKDGVIY